MVWIQDTKNIAFQGLLTGNSRTIASQGFLIEIKVEEVPDGPGLPPMLGGGSSRRRRKFHTPYPTGSRIEEQETVKLITVTVTIDGKIYTESAHTKDLSVTAEDISVDITEDKDKPTVKILLI